MERIMNLVFESYSLPPLPSPSITLHCPAFSKYSQLLFAWDLSTFLLPLELCLWSKISRLNNKLSHPAFVFVCLILVPWIILSFPWFTKFYFRLTITKSFKIGLPVITFIIMVIIAIASSLVANFTFDFVPSKLDVILVARLNFIAISSWDLLVLICFLPSAKPFHDEGYII